MHRRRSLTLTEVMVTTGILGVLALGLIQFQASSYGVYSESQTVTYLQNKGRLALERIVLECGRAVTVDPSGAPGSNILKTLYDNDDGANTGSRGILFQEITGADANGPVFGPEVAFVGPHNSADPGSSPPGGNSAGLIRLRDAAGTIDWPTNDFTSLASLQGSDGLFATFDDGKAPGPDGDPKALVLLHSNLAPQTGPMFRVDQDGTRSFTFTLRLNARQGRGGPFLLTQDLVLSERIELAQ